MSLAYRPQHEDDGLFWYGLALIVVLTIIALGGCRSHIVDGTLNSPIPMSASAVDKATAHVTSADALVKQAKPNADKTGAALLDAASGEHGMAKTALGDARLELNKASIERSKLQADLVASDAALAKVKHGWGYRLQVFVARVFVILCILVGAHFVFLIAGLMLPPPYGTALGLAGRIINPGGWFVSIIDHFHIKRAVSNVPIAAAVAAYGQPTPAP